MAAIKQALLSCHDKAGLDGFAGALASLGIRLIASGGTAEFLKQQGLSVTTVEEFAGISEQLDGRVKTLHPKIHAGILARRDDASHVRAAGPSGLIDFVIVNLYPFQQTAARSGATLAEVIEQIDVGGVALLRAAAKNFAHVAVVSDPAQYAPIAQALRAGKGRLPDALRRGLAVDAFRLTSAYDRLIGDYLTAPPPSASALPSSAPASKAAGGPGSVAGAPRSAAAEALPEAVSFTLQKRQALRYGENPHQSGAWYVPDGGAAWGLGTLTQLQGKELSYNNLLDADAALRCLLDFPDPTCVIVKHNSLCGLAGAATTAQAHQSAYACDPESAFGGIVGINRPIDAALARELTATFLEVILAPSVEPEAAEVFRKKPNLRVVTVDWPARLPGAVEWRHLLGSWLAQEADARTLHDAAVRVATKRAPTEQEYRALAFAWAAAKHVRSNAVVLAAGRETVGIGQGQPSRVGSVRLAIQKAGDRARRSVAASDGFFPFPDGIELLAQAGVAAVIQPGGSIRDKDVTAAADAANVAMLITGIRHFRH